MWFRRRLLHGRLDRRRLRRVPPDLFPVGCLHVAHESLDAQAGQDLEPQHLFVGQPVPRALDLDEGHPFGRGVPNGQVGEPGARVAVVLDQTLAHAVQLAGGEARNQAEKVVGAPGDGSRLVF